jgi:hypothetical protein
MDDALYSYPLDTVVRQRVGGLYVKAYPIVPDKVNWFAAVVITHYFNYRQISLFWKLDRTAIDDQT